MLDRITGGAQAQRLNDAINDSQVRMRDAQIAAATGKRAQRYDAIASEAGLLLRSEHARDKADNYVLQNERVRDRLNAMEGSLAAMSDSLDTFRTRLVQRLNDATNDSFALDKEADNVLQELEAQLNLRIDGRYLFAGSRSDAPAVELPAATITTADPTLYYQGDDLELSARIDEDTTVTWGITADRAAFASAIAAVGEAREAHLANDDDALRAALDQMRVGIEGIADMRGEIGANSAKVDVAVQTQQTTSDYLTETIQRIEDVDIASAITQMNRDQVNIEAAYLMTRALNELSLADYIR